MIVISRALVLASNGDINADNPIIGHHTLVTPANIAATASLPGYPASNLANPSTAERWRSAGDDIYTVLLLHMDGVDAATTFTDASRAPHTITAVGNAQVDTAQSKFGSASALFDGTGDSLTLDGSADFAFGAGDFTVDGWVRLAATGANKYIFDCRPAATNGAYPTVYVSAGNVLKYLTANAEQITGTTVLTTGVWYHVALTRKNNVTRLFLNGVQEGDSYDDVAVYLNGTSRPIIGESGFSAGASWNGWIDELRVSKGIARWDTDFTVPAAAYHTGDEYVTVTLVAETADYLAFARHNLGTAGKTLSVEVDTGAGFAEIVEEFLPGDDAPVIARFESTSALIGVRLRMQGGTLAPAIGVLYVGRLLPLQRRVMVGHTPITDAAEPDATNAFSENGNFLGRIIVGEKSSTVLSLSKLTASWYRTYMRPWLLGTARTAPFFMAWRPGTYPTEVCYGVLAAPAKPTNENTIGMMSVDLKITGLST